MIYSFVYGGIGIQGDVAVDGGGGSSPTTTGEMVLAAVNGGIFYNAADSGNHVGPGVFVIGPAQTPVSFAAQYAMADVTGGLFVVAETNKQHALTGVFLGS